MTELRPPSRPRPVMSVALLFGAVAATAFLVVRPPVGDLWAARARASAAAHGVGLHYWFSWFGGTVPGHYSVLAPYLSKFLGVGLLGALATVAITPLVHRLVRDGPHPVLSTWLAAVGSMVSLWSGRVPFAEGTALALVALLCVRGSRPVLAASAGAVVALVSPVSAVFLILGLAGVFVHDRERRLTAGVTAAVAGAVLIGIAGYFGLPGPEGFQPLQAGAATVAFALLLCARPRAEVRTVLIIALIACPIIAVVPNGMGSNFERFAWICMPVATAATATSSRRVVLIMTLTSMTFAFIGSTKDLSVAINPMSSQSYYTGLIRQLDRTTGLADYRVEVVPDGTHVAAYALLDHATLARGYETQSDNSLDSVLASPQLDAASYRTWLDSYAVAYVALDRTTLKAGPEDHLMRTATPAYLRPVWSDTHWRLFAVANPRPIVAAPGQVVDADQASLVISTPRAATLGLRLRWSPFLRVRGPAGSMPHLSSDGRGFARLAVTGAGRFVLTG